VVVPVVRYARAKGDSLEPRFVCFTGGLGPVRGRAASCTPGSVYTAQGSVRWGTMNKAGLLFRTGQGSPTAKWPEL